jgi:zinc transport system permease protein
MEFIHALTQFGFLQNAVLAGLLASAACGMVGTYVVVKRIGYLAGGIAHAVLGGMGAALFFGFSPMFGALITAVISALVLGLVKLYAKEQEDILIGALWAAGMAVGIIFIAQTPGYQVGLMTYLFGNVLLVSSHQLWMMLILNVVLIATIVLFYKQFTAITFDEEFARIRGLPVTALYLILLCLIAICVVLMIQVVGLILVIALLTLPAAISQQFTHTMKSMMALAVVLGMAFCLLGLGISYSADIPSGATIILVTTLFYLVVTVWRRSGGRGI